MNKSFGTFTIYEKEGDNPHNIIYLKNEDDLDFYDLCKSEEVLQYPYFVLCNSGTVVANTQAIDSLFPKNLEVVGTDTLIEEGKDYIWDGTNITENLDTLTYAQKRLMEYPSVGSQLDALFHAGVFPDDMAATIQAIKDKYPKE